MNIYEMLDTVKGLPEGDYAECGVWKGWMAEKIAANLAAKSTLWLFDSFAGHAEPTEFDDAKHHPKGRYADTSAEEIQTKFPNARIVPGWIPDTLLMADFYANRFRFVHIDVDHYLPTKGACEFFKSRMVKGGIIRFDDYEVWGCPGATKAVDEIFGRDNILPGDYRWISN